MNRDPVTMLQKDTQIHEKTDGTQKISNEITVKFNNYTIARMY